MTDEARRLLREARSAQGDTPDLDDPAYGLDSAFNACMFKFQCQALRKRLREAEAKLAQGYDAARKIANIERGIRLTGEEQAEWDKDKQRIRQLEAEAAEPQPSVREAQEEVREACAKACDKEAREFEESMEKCRAAGNHYGERGDRVGMLASEGCARAVRSLDRARFGGERKNGSS